MEDLILVVGYADVRAIANNSDGVGDQVSLAARGQPELVIDEFLVEGEAASLADREESETEMEIIVKARDQAPDLAVLLVDPDAS